MISRSVGAFFQREMVGCEQTEQTSGLQLEGRIVAQPVEVITIWIAAADRQHSGSQHIGDRVRDVRRIMPASNVSGSVSATLRRRSASASSITLLSEDIRPPSNAAVLLRKTDRRLKLS